MATAGAVSAGLALGGGAIGLRTAQAGNTPTKAYKTQLYKSKIDIAPTDELCEHWLAAGFEGLELKAWKVPVEEARKSRQIADKHGFRLHSVMRGRALFNHKDESIRRRSIEDTKHGFLTSAAYGAETLLFVPCSIGDGAFAMPDPWDYEVDFDPATLMVKSVVPGDNSKYVDYIARYNESTAMSIQAFEELIPIAAKEGVIMGIEHVLNNLWCTPEHFAAFIRYFNTPWLLGYFDAANNAKYSKPELWVRALGHSLVKLHLKGYKITQERGKRGGGEGDWSKVDESTIDWKAIRDALEDVNFNGWVSIEERGQTDERYAQIIGEFDAGTLVNKRL